MTFAMERNWVAGAACVAVAGEVDVETAPRMRDALVEAVADGEQVVVDLGSVTFMDSTGLAALVVAGRVAEARGVRLRLRAVPPRVMELITTTGRHDLISLETLPRDDSRH
jgi:anti-sigma B factor antagonist